MRRLIVGFLATLGILSLLTVAAIGGVVWWWISAYDTAEELPDRMVVTIDLDGGIAEASPGGPVGAFMPEWEPLGLVDVVEAIDRAATDSRVAGILVDLSGARLGLAQTQELRAAVFRLRASGRTASVFADSYEGDGIGPYYLASAFDRIWLQPSGLLALTGLSLEIPLARGLLARLGLEPEFEERFEFKGAMTPLTSRSLPPAIRENLSRVAESLYGQVVSGIASARRLGGNSVSEMIDRGPLLADEALANGLVDVLGYRDEARAAAVEGSGELVGVTRYLAARPESQEEATRIALIHLDGVIERGAGGRLSGGDVAFAATVEEAVDDVLDDDRVRGVILRISSPGGSYVASDSIRNAIARLRRGGIPVIASFADVAASGGYFAALPADHILAHPATLTGSIGAVGGKVSGGDLLDEMDVEVGRIEIGANAGMFSPTRPFSADERLRLRRMLDAIYADFTKHVGEARRLSDSEVDAVARGRVWTGEDARRVGLVDALGGYAEALQLTRQSIGLAPGAPIDLVAFPGPLDTLESLLEAFREGDIETALTTLKAIATYSRVLGHLAPLGWDGLMRAQSVPLETGDWRAR